MGHILTYKRALTALSHARITVHGKYIKRHLYANDATVIFESKFKGCVFVVTTDATRATLLREFGLVQSTFTQDVALPDLKLVVQPEGVGFISYFAKEIQPPFNLPVYALIVREGSSVYGTEQYGDLRSQTQAAMFSWKAQVRPKGQWGYSEDYAAHMFWQYVVKNPRWPLLTPLARRCLRISGTIPQLGTTNFCLYDGALVPYGAATSIALHAIQHERQPYREV